MEELFREAAEVGGGYFAVTLATYNGETSELVVEQQATGPGSEGTVQTLEVPAPRRIAETVVGRSAAICQVVALADDWIGVVLGGLASA